MTYDFKTLSPLDFEDLSRDLVSADTGLKFEAFAPGPDGGIDGRHSDAAGKTVLQAKHYAESGYSALKARLKVERKKMDALNPSRYILTTSVPLTPKRKAELEAILHPYIKNSSDIYDRTQLNEFNRLYCGSIYHRAGRFISSIS